MTLKQIKKNHWYKTTLGVGQAVRVGGTYPPSVQVNIVAPFPRGIVNMKPRDIERELSASELPATLKGG